MLLVNLKKLAFSMFFILSHAIWSQSTLDIIEAYIFEPIFDSCVNDEINEIIEEDENSKISRKWFFNEYGLLSKEIDFRESGFNSEMGGEIFSSSINYKEYGYHYNADNKIAKVIVSMVQDKDTIKTVKSSVYINNNLIKEDFTSLKIGGIKKETSENTYLSKGLKDSTIFISISKVSKLHSEWKSKTVYAYNEENKIKKEISYFKSNFHPPLNDEKPMLYQRSSETYYEYNHKGKIDNITTYHYDDSGVSKINQKTIFKYEGSTSRLISVIIPIINSESQDNLKLSLIYNEQGCLKQINSVHGSVYYEYTGKK